VVLVPLAGGAYIRRIKSTNMKTTGKPVFIAGHAHMAEAVNIRRIAFTGVGTVRVAYGADHIHRVADAYTAPIEFINTKSHSSIVGKQQ
jgi:hypothetical protein